MSPELAKAREHLRHCQRFLYEHRGQRGAPWNPEISRRMTSLYEEHVKHALDALWQAQCLEVFTDPHDDDSWFDSDSCVSYINSIDWSVLAREMTAVWRPIETAPDRTEVQTKIDDHISVRNKQNLIRQGRLWFLPNSSTYVYYTPTHWRPK